MTPYPPHLTTGSERPPTTEGKLRLYSMNFCPYAERARLVLRAKNIPHDIVNINLINKPQWYFDIHPEGKVPSLDIDGKIFVESLDISELLDEKYPDPPLYPSDPAAKQADKELIQKIGPLTGVFSQLLFEADEKTPEEWAKEFEPHLEVFEKELERRGTPYFGGESPGMVDYMLWPWPERAGTVNIRLGQRLPLGENQFPLSRQWRKLMRQHPVVEEIAIDPEEFWKVVQFKLKNSPPDYDNL